MRVDGARVASFIADDTGGFGAGWNQFVNSSASSCISFVAGFRFPPDVILLAVRWYLRYGLSYRYVEELLTGHSVDHVTIYRWVQQFTPLVIEPARPCRHSAGDTSLRLTAWEMCVKVFGVRLVGRWGFDGLEGRFPTPRPLGGLCVSAARVAERSAETATRAELQVTSRRARCRRSHKNLR